VRLLLACGAHSAAAGVAPLSSRNLCDFCHASEFFRESRFMKLQDLVTAIDKQRQHSNLSSAIRLFVLDFYRSRASDIEAEVNFHEMLLATRPWSAP
jgi:predicted DNA-binding ribbon-helix-helix protein